MIKNHLCLKTVPIRYAGYHCYPVTGAMLMMLVHLFIRQGLIHSFTRIINRSASMALFSQG
jgi:hypothetical protein